MIRLIGSLLILALIVLGGLFALGAGLQRAAEAALAASGSQVGAVSVEGLPARLALRLEAPDLRAPDGRSGWSAAALVAAASPFSPLHWRAELPPEQVLTLGGQRYPLRAEDLVIEAGFGARESLPLTTAALRATRLDLDLPPEFTAPGAAPAEMFGARDLVLTLDTLPPSAERPAPPGGALYHLSATAGALGLPPEVATLIALHRADLPAEVEAVAIEADFGLARPLDRHAVAGMLYLTGLDIAEARLDWGGRRIEVSGPLSFDAAGRPEGRLMLRLPDWRAWYDLARKTGVLPENRAPMVAAIAGQMAAQAPDGVLALPLTFARGQMSLGPVPLGPVPSLR